MDLIDAVYFRWEKTENILLIFRHTKDIFLKKTSFCILHPKRRDGKFCWRSIGSLANSENHQFYPLRDSDDSRSGVSQGRSFPRGAWRRIFLHSFCSFSHRSSSPRENHGIVTRLLQYVPSLIDRCALFEFFSVNDWELLPHLRSNQAQNLYCSPMIKKNSTTKRQKKGHKMQALRPSFIREERSYREKTDQKWKEQNHIRHREAPKQSHRNIKLRLSRRHAI